MNKLFYGLLFLSQFANAGGWISSGGESLIFARNPWFVKNVSTVDYCVQMDEASFSVNRQQVDQLIAEAFGYWKSEFLINNGVGGDQTGFAKVGTQDFHAVKCQSETPLIFKLGVKTLNEKEVEYLIDPKKFIGVTIRKNYSLEKLQGDGIIYISADKGADAYTNNGQLITEAWKNPSILRYALIHELGHFFGIPHVGSGIMSEVFMTVLLNRRLTHDFESSPQLSFLNPQSVFEVCRDGGGVFNPDFFALPRETLCLKFELVPGSSPQWSVSSKTKKEAPYEKVGVVQVHSLDQSPYALKPAVIVQLPDEQKVFSATETLFGPFLVGAVFSDISYNGSFRPQGGIRAFPIQMSLSSEKISFVGTVNNLQMTVMTYAPLSFMKAIFP